MHVKVNHLKCAQCGHEWIPRKSQVYICPNPKCHSPKWRGDKE